MLDKKSTAKALRNLFHRDHVAAMDDLFRALDTQCRMSVFRRLKEIGYRTSYTHCGRYYTLENIPKFDERGLWFYQDVGFSKSGTLKATLKTLVVEVGRPGSPMRSLRDCSTFVFTAHYGNWCVRMQLGGRIWEGSTCM